MFYDDTNTTHLTAFLPGEAISDTLQGIKIELSFGVHGKLVARFQPHDFMHVSRLDMRALLAQAIGHATQTPGVLTTSTNTPVEIKLAGIKMELK